MPIDLSVYQKILSTCSAYKAKLVAVSKTKPVADIQELYAAGQRDFAENYVQELLEKQPQLPSDIRWHFIGHLQSNKVKQIAGIVHLIHGVDSVKLLQEIDKQGKRIGKTIACLLQVHIAREETKFGFDETSLKAFWEDIFSKRLFFDHVQIDGFMGMASFSEDQDLVRSEFRSLKSIAASYLPNGIISMGMSADYQLALEEGSNLIRIGSLLFGSRN